MSILGIIGGVLLGACVFGGKKTDKYDVKVRFFDKYRELDVYLSRMVGESYGGVGLLISACTHIANKTGSSQHRQTCQILNDIRNYRNKLAHNKGRWESIEDIDTSYIDYIDSLMSHVRAHSTEYQQHLAGALMHRKRLPY